MPAAALQASNRPQRNELPALLREPAAALGRVLDRGEDARGRACLAPLAALRVGVDALVRGRAFLRLGGRDDAAMATV